MSDEEIKRLRELCDAATPGPWKAQFRAIEQLTDAGKGYPLDVYPDSVTITPAQCDECGLPFSMAEADRVFIAASRTLVPQLLAEVERMTPVYEAAPACPFASADGWLMCQLKRGHGGSCQMKDVSHVAPATEGKVDAS